MDLDVKRRLDILADDNERGSSLIAVAACNYDEEAVKWLLKDKVRRLPMSKDLPRFHPNDVDHYAQDMMRA
jgi:hypothetical protein